MGQELPLVNPEHLGQSTWAVPTGDQGRGRAGPEQALPQPLSQHWGLSPPQRLLWVCLEGAVRTWSSDSKSDRRTRS